MWLEVQYFLFFWVVSVDTWKVLRTSSQLSPQWRAGPQTAVDQCQCLSSISLKWTVVHSLKDSLISSLYESLSLHFILPLACFLSVLSYMSPLSLSRLFNQSIGSLLSELLPPPGCIDASASECFSVSLSASPSVLRCDSETINEGVCWQNEEAAGTSDTGRGKLQINDSVFTDRNMDSFFLSDL